MSTTTAPAPPPSAPAAPLVNVAPGNQPATPFKYEDTSGMPTSSEAFDKMFGNTAPAPPPDIDPPKSEPAPKQASPAPEPSKEASKPALDDGLPTEAPKPAEEPAKPVPEPKNAPELREAYYRSKEVLAAKEKELAELRAQVSAKPKADLNGEAETYQARIKELQDRVSEYETEIKFADYSRSKEYKETYEAPLAAEVQRAKNEIQSFTVTQADGTERQADISDIRPLLNMAPGAAWKAAREVFGDAAPAIMAYRDRIVGLNEKAQGALDDFRTKGAERLKIQEQELTQKQAQEIEQRFKTFDSHVTERATQLPALYGEDPADPDGNKLLEAGRRLTTIAFKGSKEVKPEEMVKIQAEVAARATGFGRMVHRVKTLEAKLAEATKKLESYEKSEPGKGSRDAGETEPDSDTPAWQREFDKIPSMRR